MILESQSIKELYLLEQSSSILKSSILGLCFLQGKVPID